MKNDAIVVVHGHCAGYTSAILNGHDNTIRGPTLGVFRLVPVRGYHVLDSPGHGHLIQARSNDEEISMSVTVEKDRSGRITGVRVDGQESLNEGSVVPATCDQLGPCPVDLLPVDVFFQVQIDQLPIVIVRKVSPTAPKHSTLELFFSVVLHPELQKDPSVTMDELVRASECVLMGIWEGNPGRPNSCVEFVELSDLDKWPHTALVVTRFRRVAPAFRLVNRYLMKVPDVVHRWHRILNR
jgi:hypothetical protein